MEYEAQRLALKALENQPVREVAERCQVSHSWLVRWLGGHIRDPGIHRIGRVIERLS